MSPEHDELRLSEADHAELVELYVAAENTPVIFIHGRSMADSAWQSVRQRIDQLGRKYDFDPDSIRGIDRETGEVLL